MVESGWRLHRTLRVGGAVRWWLAVCAWLLAVLLSAVPLGADTVTTVSGFTFSWTQLAMLVGIGAAWGDMRAQMKSMKERVDRIESYVHEKGGKK